MIASLMVNELVASNDEARNGLINGEDMSEEQIHNLAIPFRNL
jgi:hypothetical protein